MAPVKYGSVCSGIESASIAWEPLGWSAAWFSEVEPFPSAVLAHRWPHVANLGDMTQLPALIAAGLIEAPDILVGGNVPMVAAFSAGQSKDAGSIAYKEEQAPTLRGGASGTNQVPTLHAGTTVRRLTPRECERLQGFPDDHTLIPWRGKPPEDCPDGPRYKAIGNSKAVPVIRWVGERTKKHLEEAIIK